MEEYFNIELEDCPVCRGPGMIEIEAGWCAYVVCADCGSHTAEVAFETEDEKREAIRRSADTWNMGKVVPAAPGS